MATGWAGDNAVNEQIEATIADAVKRARARLPSGPSAQHCEHCEAPIPEGRRRALPGVKLCVACQTKVDQTSGARAGYNRRGSKDSQLR